MERPSRMRGPRRLAVRTELLLAPIESPRRRLELRERLQRVARVHHRRPGAHVDRHAERLAHLVARGALLMILRMVCSNVPPDPAFSGEVGCI